MRMKTTVWAAVLAGVLAACSQANGSAAPPDSVEAPAPASEAGGSDVELSPMALRAAQLMVWLEPDPDHTGRQGSFWEVFQNIYAAEWPNVDTPTTRVYGQALKRADDYARAGNGGFLDAIMRARYGPYGRTAEGSAAFAEILWANFELNPGLTIAVMDEMTQELRTQLVEDIYTQPPHEYDFDKILPEIHQLWSEEVRADVRRISAVLHLRLLPADAAIDPAAAGRLAREADALLRTLATDPAAAEVRREFLRMVDRIYSRYWETAAPDTKTVFAAALTRAHDYAQAGDGAFLAALMHASLRSLRRHGRGH